MRSKFDDVVDSMSEEERIEFIRENGTEAQKRGMKSVFDDNKYKPKRQEMWNERLHKGRKMVRVIFQRWGGEKDI